MPSVWSSSSIISSSLLARMLRKRVARSSSIAIWMTASSGLDTALGGDRLDVAPFEPRLPGLSATVSVSQRARNTAPDSSSCCACARHAGSRYAASRSSSVPLISPLNDGTVLNVNGSAIVIWNVSGRHVTCGHTSAPVGALLGVEVLHRGRERGALEREAARST